MSHLAQALPKPLILVALMVLAGPAPARTQPVPRDIPETHYLVGRLLEERGDDVEALAEYTAALRADTSAADIEVRIAEVSARLGETERSLEFAARALRHEPGHARALWLRGAALLNLDRPAEALASLEAAVAADSEQVDYWRTLARAAEQQDRIGEVSGYWRHIVQLDDSDGEAWFQLAAAEARLGHFQEADSLLDEAVAINPVRPGAIFLKGWIVENLGRREEAIELYRHHLQLHPGDQTARRRLVNQLVDAGRYDEAYREAVSVSRASPEDPEALQVEADLALRLGHDATARDLFDRMGAVAPDDPDVILQVVGVLARRGRGEEAVRRADAWAARHPGGLHGAMLAAQARSLAGRDDEAVAAARRVVSLAPDSLAPNALLAGILQSRKRYAEAESVWMEVQRRFPDRAHVGLEIAFCREQHGDLEGAVSAARDALAGDPEDAEALNFLGYLFADHDRDLSEAESLIGRALAKEPDNGAFVDSMGWVYYRQGRLEAARSELERAVRLSGGDPTVHEHLGDVYNGLRLFELAREQYRLSLQRDQGNQRVRSKLAEIR